MMKLSVMIVCLALLGSVFAEIKKEQIEIRARDSAQWVVDKLPAYLKTKDTFQLSSIKSLKAKLEKETVFQMVLEVVNIQDSKQTGMSTCNVEIIDQITTNTRLISTAKCTKTATF